MISGQSVGPLHRIPFATKDNDDTNDTRTTAGAAAR
jgi:Asp-tRNA(Asn)/Glu-tRNA(Gln) amidotransferase A subunit family amidase